MKKKKKLTVFKKQPLKILKRKKKKMEKYTKLNSEYKILSKCFLLRGTFFLCKDKLYFYPFLENLGNFD